MESQEHLDLKPYGIGFIARLISMVVCVLLPIKTEWKVIGLFLTDFIDCKVLKMIGKGERLCKNFNYQGADKVFDILTYFIILVLYSGELGGISNLLTVLAIYRLVGVGVFYWTKKSLYLTFFPDLFKEVYLYNLYLTPITTVSFVGITGLKTMFEYFFHQYFNKQNPEKK